MDDRVRETLEKGNPWWRDPAERPRRVLPYRRRPYAHLQREVFRSPAGKDRAILMTGMRQVGKTELSRQVLAEALSGKRLTGRQIAYVKVDDLRIDGAISMADVVEAWSPYRDTSLPALLVIDEVQKLSDKGQGREHAWAHQLKGAVDDQSFRILATGSEALDLDSGSVAGPGRWDRLVLEPLSFREFRELGSYPHPPRPATLFVDLDRYLSLGGFPEIAQMDDRPRALERIRQYARDALSETGSRIPREMGQVFAVLMDQSGEELNIGGLSGQLGHTRVTVERWVEGFEDAYLIDRIPRLESSTLRELRGNPKVHAADPGLAAAFSRHLDPLSDSKTRARLVECAVNRHLREVARAASGRLRYLQDRTGGRRKGEVDFVLICPEDIWLIEVTTSGDSAEKAAFVHGQAKDIRMKDRRVHGMVVFGGSSIEENVVRCVPVARFLDEVVGGTSSDPCDSLRSLATRIDHE